MQNVQEPLAEQIHLNFLCSLEAEYLLPCENKASEQITKYQMRRGNSLYNLCQDENITVHYYLEMRTANGLLVKEQQVKNVKKIKLFNDCQWEGIHLAIQSMQEQEVSWFQIGSHFHQMHSTTTFQQADHLTHNQQQQQHQPLYAKIEVMQIDIKSNKNKKKPESISEKQIYLQDFFKEIEEFRVMGNKQYEEREYPQSIKTYQKIMNAIVGFPMRFLDEMAEESGCFMLSELSRYKVVSLNNMAQCQMSQNQYGEAKRSLEKLMEIDRFNVKSHYRLARVLEYQKDFEKAIEQYEKYIGMLEEGQEQEREQSQKRMEAIRQRISNQNDREKNVYSHIFTNIQQEEQQHLIQQKRKEQQQERSIRDGNFNNTD